VQSLTLDNGRNEDTMRIYSIITGLVVTGINSLMTMLLLNIAPYERHVQFSAALGSTTAKLTSFYLLNSIGIPILAVYLTNGSDQSWCARPRPALCYNAGMLQCWNAGRTTHAACRYVPGGIAQEAFYIQVFNIVMPNVSALANMPYPLYALLLSHRARTQPTADALLHPPPFLLPLRVADTVRTVALSVLYAPVLPVSLFLGLLASVFSCATLRCFCPSPLRLLAPPARNPHARAPLRLLVALALML
jgi:hypothetical protein